MNPGPWFPEPDRRRKNAPQEQDEDGDGSFADVYNGFSFGSRRKTRKRGDEPKQEQNAQDEPRAQPEQTPPQDERRPLDKPEEERERARESFRSPPPSGPPPGPSTAERSMPGLPVPGQSVPGLPIPGQPPRGQAPPGRPLPEPPAAPPEKPEPEPPEEEYAVASSIRSYTWTGGRTKSNHQLEMETLVSTSDMYRPGSVVRMEHQSIAEMCQHPRSVAEVGALMSLPIGVTRVLLADMAELGLISVHQTVSESGSAPHLMLMERVLSGLRRL